MVISDLDGTLVGDDDHISARTRDTLRKLVSQGVFFSMATGRPLRRIDTIIRKLDIPCLVACANGALIYDPAVHRILECRELSADDVRAIILAIRDIWPSCQIAAERLVKTASGQFEQVLYAERSATQDWPAGDSARGLSLAALSTGPAIKIMVRSPRQRSADMAAAAARSLNGAAEVTYANANNGLIEISRIGANKGLAARTMAGIFNVKSDAAVAFGDMPNDIPMLRWSGYSVAVGNAHEEVREVADEVTLSCDDDGVAHVLEERFPDAR